MSFVVYIWNASGQNLAPSRRRLKWELSNGADFAMVKPGVFESRSRSGFSSVTVTDEDSGLKASAELVIQRGSSSSGGFSTEPSPLMVCLKAGACRYRVVAGVGTAGNEGDFEQATSASLNDPHGLALDSKGNLYIADSLNQKIREVQPSGVISTYAGLGLSGFNLSEGHKRVVRLNYPHSINIDNSGTIYFSDKVNNRIRKIDPVSEQLTTVAGGGVNGDGALATAASLNFPLGIVTDSVGNIYFSDSLNNKVRKVDKSTGIITTIAGNGNFGQEGDNGLATQAELNFPHGLAMDSQDRLYIADALNHKIRKVDLQTGIITTVAGAGESGYSGDGGQATGARLNGPRGVALNRQGDIFISDSYNKVVRMVDGRTSQISTIAGGGRGAESSALAINFQLPYDLSVSREGRLLVVDSLANKVFEIIP